MVDASGFRNGSQERHEREATYARAVAHRRRATAARVALGANAVLQGGGVVLALHQIVLFSHGAESVDPAVAEANLARFNILESLSWLLLFAGAATFLPWLHGAMDIAKRLTSRLLDFTPGGAVAAFFIPIVSLWRPYQAIRDLDAKIEPSEIPLPEVRPADDFTAGYRDAAVASQEPLSVTRPAPVLLWWMGWLFPATISIAGLAVTDSITLTLGCALVYRVTEAAAAVLAFVVVSRIQNRLEELAKRRVALFSDT